MTVFRALSAKRFAGVTICMAVGALLALAYMTAGAHAGSSTHAKTTPGTQTTPGSQEKAAQPRETPEHEEKRQKDAGTEGKTAKAEMSAETSQEDKTASPIGAGWETDTQIRPDVGEKEITDEEALEIIERVNAYFNDLTKLKAEFVQTEGNNEEKSGEFYFKRPGKVRFDYDRPSRMKIISNGEYLAVENHDLRTSDRYPLEATPFKLLLSEDVNLLRDARILAIDKGKDVLILSLEDKTGKSAGTIRLFFRTNPNLQLASWIITDPQGVDTRVDLSSLERDVELSAELFEFSDISLPKFNR